MKQLRVIRLFLAVIFFIASVAFLVFGPGVHPMAVASEKSQVILSAVNLSIGATLVWLLLSFLFGRIYCSTVCPVGTLTDIVMRLRLRIPRFSRPHSYRHKKRWSIHILIVYCVCLLIGLSVVPFLIEPWNIMRNICSAVNPSAVERTWIALGLGGITGAVAGTISFVLLVVCALFAGRSFCTDVCPLGTAMGLIGDQTVFHIEIDPDRCTSCGICEENCKSDCIKVMSRYVDNTRCVRCFNCLANCPEDAIRFQPDRNRPLTPLMRKTKKSVK